MNASPTVEGFFDPETHTVSYLVSDPATGDAAIIDPVLNYDAASGRTSSTSIETLLDRVARQGLTLTHVLETHAHADHLSAAQFLKARTGGRIAISENICTVQSVFQPIFNLEPSFLADGSQFDHLFKDGEKFMIGNIEATALLVPGHTPADMAYWVGDAVFVGDTLFMPDAGTARADFPGGNAHALYQSIQKLLALPLETRIFVCHDYPPDSRKPHWQTSVREQRASNIHVHDGITEEAFVAMRSARDATLEMPTLILPSIQVNIRAGRLPPAEDNGISYLKMPVNVLGGKRA